MPPDRFAYPPIPTDLPPLKPEISPITDKIKNIPITEAQDISVVPEILETPIVPESSPSIEAPINFSEGRPETPSEDIISQSRNAYLEQYATWQKFDSKKLPRTEVKKVEYEAEKERLSNLAAQAHSEYRRVLEKTFNEELEKARVYFMDRFGVEPAADALADVKAELIKKYVIEEASIMEGAKAEGWPPKEKKLWQKTLESYSSLPKAARFAISATVGTAFVAAFSTASVAGAAGVLGIGAVKMARSAMGYEIGRGVSSLTNLLFEKARKKDEAKHEKEIAASPESFFDISEQHHKFLETQKKIDAWKKAEQVALGLAVGVGASNVMSLGENTLEHSLGLKTESAPFVNGKLINPEPKSYLPGNSPEEQIKPDLGEPVPIPDAELNYMPAKTGVAAEHLISSEKPSAVVSPDHLPKSTNGAPIPETGDFAEQTERLTVHQGEGLWQPVSREVEFRIKADPEKYGLSAEDVADENSVSLAKAVARETNQILRSNEVMDATGEIRVSQPGVVLHLSEDGKLEISDVSKLYSHDFAEVPAAASEELGDSPIPVVRSAPSSSILSDNLDNHSRPVNVSELSSSEPPTSASSSGRIAELGDESVPVGARNLSAFRSSPEPLVSTPASPEINPLNQPWHTEGLVAHEKLEPLIARTEELTEKMDESFFIDLEKAPLSELEKYENLLNGGQADILEMERLIHSLEGDNLVSPESYSNTIDLWKDRIERLAEIKAERLAQFANFEKTLPPDYIHNSSLTLKQYLNETLKFDIPGQPSSRALEDFINSANYKPSEMNLKLRDFMASRFNEGGFHTAPLEQNIPELTIRVSPDTISSAMKAHAQINLAKMELPEYSRELDSILSSARDSSFADFQKNFVTAPEVATLKDDVTKICSATSEKIKLLEDAGWKVGPAIKESVTETIKKAIELDVLSHDYEERFNNWLSAAGFENPHDYVISIAEAKDAAGNSVTIDLGSVLDMARNYTPSQMGKFSGFVEAVGELAKNLSPEELTIARKLPVDEFIKQNIKL